MPIACYTTQYGSQPTNSRNHREQADSNLRFQACFYCELLTLESARTGRTDFKPIAYRHQERVAGELPGRARARYHSIGQDTDTRHRACYVEATYRPAHDLSPFTLWSYHNEHPIKYPHLESFGPTTQIDKRPASQSDIAASSTKGE